MGCECKSSFSVSGKLRLYISFNVQYLSEKIFSLIQKMDYQPEITNGYLVMVTENFEDFVVKLLAYDLSSAELENINILALELEEKLDFSSFTKIRTLKKWSKLLGSVNLLNIIESNSLTIHFQQIIDLKARSVFGYECLTRVIKQQDENINPMEIFEFARENDLLFKLDNQTRKNAIKAASEKNITAKIFINFIPTSIYNPENCLKETVKLIEEYNIKPEQIIFEVVETEKIENLSHLKNIIDFYKNKGFKTALDDVASGYSSLNTFIYLKPDIIKIDQNVIRDIDKDKAKQSVFNALVNIAGENGTEVLAEGVETREELDFVNSFKIDYAQGYYFSRPSAEPVINVTL